VIYCISILEQGDLDYVHFESHHPLAHKTSAIIDHLRYLSLIVFAATLQQKLGLRKSENHVETVNQLIVTETTIEE
jgi:hypothetical protein